MRDKQKEIARVFLDISKYSLGAGLIAALISPQTPWSVLLIIVVLGIVSFCLGWYLYPEEDERS